MIDWKSHLTAEEAGRLREIEDQNMRGSIDKRRIYQRAWRRAKLAQNSDPHRGTI